MTPSGQSDATTLRYYASEAPDYVASGPGRVSRFLHGFLDRLPAGAHILELGCGGGRDAEAMLARGFDVTPTDGVPEMARQAEARLGRTVRVMKFSDLDENATWDAVYANASLLHVPREGLPAVLGAIHRALKPGGLHFANYKAGGTEGRDDRDRYFNYLSRDQLMAFYAQSARWETVEVIDYQGGGDPRGPIPWVAAIMRRPGGGTNQGGLISKGII